MARLPVTGGDGEAWGDILNQYLLVAHNADGTQVNPVILNQTVTASGTVTAPSWATKAEVIVVSGGCGGGGAGSALTSGGVTAQVGGTGGLSGNCTIAMFGPFTGGQTFTATVGAGGTGGAGGTANGGAGQAGNQGGDTRFQQGSGFLVDAGLGSYAAGHPAGIPSSGNSTTAPTVYAIWSPSSGWTLTWGPPIWAGGSGGYPGGPAMLYVGGGGGSGAVATATLGGGGGNAGSLGGGGGSNSGGGHAGAGTGPTSSGLAGQNGTDPGSGGGGGGGGAPGGTGGAGGNGGPGIIYIRWFAQ